MMQDMQEGTKSHCQPPKGLLWLKGLALSELLPPMTMEPLRDEEQTLSQLPRGILQAIANPCKAGDRNTWPVD